MTTENERLKELFGWLKTPAYSLLEQIYNLLYDDEKTDDEAMKLIEELALQIKIMFKDVPSIGIFDDGNILNSWTILIPQVIGLDGDIFLTFGKIWRLFRTKEYDIVTRVSEDPKNVYYAQRWSPYIRRLEMCLIRNIIPLEDISNDFIEWSFRKNFDTSHPYLLDICEMFIRIVPVERFQQMSSYLAYPPESRFECDDKFFEHDRSAKFYDMFTRKGVKYLKGPEVQTCFTRLTYFTYFSKY